MLSNAAVASDEITVQSLAERVTKLENRLEELEKKQADISAEEIQIPQCAEFIISKYKDTPGKKCKTSGGFVYERTLHPTMGLTWRAPDRLVWSELMGQATYGDARKACNKIGAKLPTGRAWETAERMENRQVVATLLLKDYKDNLPTKIAYWSTDTEKDKEVIKIIGPNKRFIFEVTWDYNEFNKKNPESSKGEMIRHMYYGEKQNSFYFHCVSRDK